MQLMLLGAAGIVTSLTSLLLSFTDATGVQTANRILVLLGGLVGLRLLAGSPFVDRLLTRLTEWALRRFTLVLGIYRDHSAYLGIPISQTSVLPGDRLVVV